MRAFLIDRSTAENLVDVLEDCPIQASGDWRHKLAAEIRAEFGMVTREREIEFRKNNPPKP